MYINSPGHMTKMATMSVYGKNPLKYSPEQGNNVHCHDPVFILNYFMASST